MSDRGFVPQISECRVRVMHKDDIENMVAVHSIPTMDRINDCQQQITIVPPDGKLTEFKYNMFLKHRHVNNRTCGFKGRKIIELPDRSMNVSDAYDYTVAASEEHGYWFCVYHDALPDDKLEELRGSSDSRIKELAMSELSLTELLCVAEAMEGVEVIQDHTPQETFGYVSDTFVDRKT